MMADTSFIIIRAAFASILRYERATGNYYFLSSVMLVIMAIFQNLLLYNLQKWWCFQVPPMVKIIKNKVGLIDNL